jgi:NAD(P)-dependent dehydrogenase (short-subunit alcohol dehydrogenase family)
MLLKDKVALVYGGAGAVGSAAAHTFAREGAKVALVGRNAEPLKKVAAEIRAEGGYAEAAVVDATDLGAVEDHLDAVLGEHGRLDVVLNATSFDGGTQGTPLREMTLESFRLPAFTVLATGFHIGTAAGRRMGPGGVILMMSTSAAGLSGRDRLFHTTGGFGVACAAVEELTRSLAADVGRDGIRVVCLRPDALPETWTHEGMTADHPEHPAAPFYRYMTDGTVLGRMPTLQQVADTAAYVASDRAGALTGTVVNLTCGSIT